MPTRKATWRLLACIATGCGNGSHSVEAALEEARPHVAHFAEFDAWARRALQADAVLDTRAALGETVFAKVRDDEGVVAAWLDRVRRKPEHLAFPAGALPPEQVQWVLVRTAEVGELLVAMQRPCGVQLVGSRRGRPQQCVLLRRELSLGPAERLTVTVAYAAPSNGAP